ncbi:AMP-binding protein [Chloroflexota bacterium]
MIPVRYTSQEFEKLSKEGYFGQPAIGVLEENAEKYPDKQALVDSKTRLTYGQIKQKSERLALSFIEIGLQKDERVVIQVPNIVEYFIIRSALGKAGLIGLYAMLYLREKEMEFACRGTEASAIIIIPEFHNFNYFNMFQQMRSKLPNLRHIFVVGDVVPEGAISITEMMNRPADEKRYGELFPKTMIKPGEVLELKMTSGTTGLPKLTEQYQHGTRLEIGSNSTSDDLESKYGVVHEDIFAALAPLTGGASGGAICKGVALRQGCKVVMLERFDTEEALKLIEREKITFGTGVPTMMAKMIRHPDFDKYDLSSMRVFHTAGAYLPPALAKEFEEKVGCRVVNHYGASDIGFATSNRVDDPLEVRLSSVGKPSQGVTLRLIDDDGNDVPQGQVGEILWSTQRKGISYYRDLEATLSRESQGLTRTGDLGKLDENGNLYIVGRKKDMIIRGGQNIFPAEIESILITHPKILNVAVVSMPDPVMGEKACAFVVPRSGKTLTFDEMVSFMLEKKCAKYKLPERLEIVDSFPMSGDDQKIMKRELTEMVKAKLAEESSTDV